MGRTLCQTAIVVAMTATLVFAQTNMIEPTAGMWKTWVISSGRDYRVPPPPDAAATAGELEWLRGVTTENDPRIADQVLFWESGAPTYRWMDLIHNRFLEGQPVTPWVHRVYTYVALAMYDATIATWESKYFYNRRRPSEVDPTLRTAVPVPRSPSYPSEHAATAAAAATVLSYFFPAEAAGFNALAEEAARSRLYAGLQFPSDYFAGLELGRRVGERVIERARADGSDAVWTGTIPTGTCMWTGTNPGNVTMPNWRPLLLSSPSEFRSPPPPDCQSAAARADVNAVRQYARTFTSNYKAYYWQSPQGLITGFYDFESRWMFEDKLDQNPPRAARAYALLTAAHFDSFIASNDGKFFYWYLRPHQLDTGITPLFPVPNFPSYPSNHSTLSTARGEILAYLFPKRADFARAYGKEAGDSRIWAGIHYEFDNQAGVDLGKAVANKFIAWARSDGSN
jgi:membrane-associated phospholipid phosphatase